MFDLSFYKGKKVFVTGHTGFKGSWLTHVLNLVDSVVAGYSLDPPTNPSLFELTSLSNKITSIKGDIRNLDHLKETIKAFQPEIVIHMAAQALVRESYENPVYTYETNVLGTVNILEAIRHCDTVKSFINVTTDKVYKNKEWLWSYRENEELNGFDPYSNSKSCSEIITQSYQKSFFQNKDIAISTVRSGNVIGGGDFAKDRIIPDCIRAAERDAKISLRNPHAIRPYQHVLEPIAIYLVLAMLQHIDRKKYEGSYNVGPEDSCSVNNEYLVKVFCEVWGGKATYEIKENHNQPHEANYLKLDISKVKSILGYRPKWGIEEAICKTVEWAKCRLKNGNLVDCMESQIREYLGKYTQLSHL